MLDLTLSSNYLTDAMGEAYQHVEYLPFGEIFLEERNTGQDKNTYLYNGKELDEATGLYYYGARYYDAQIGRFMKVDPIAEDFVHVTPYNYAENSPIANIDLWGLQRYWVGDGRYAGQIGTSNQMRVIQPNKIAAYKAFKLNNQSISNPKIFPNSVAFHKASNNAITNITQKIYEKKILSGKRLETINIKKGDAKGTGMSMTRGQKNLTIYINLSRNGEFIHDNYFNFINLLYHEEHHGQGWSGDGWTHFKIGINQLNHWSYKNTSENFKIYMEKVMRGYLNEDIEAGMNDWLFMGGGHVMTKFKSKEFQNAMKQYYKNVKLYNQYFNTNYKPVDYEKRAKQYSEQ